MTTKPEIPKEENRAQIFENTVKTFHTKAADTLLKLMEAINSNDENHDPSGWRIYGFDSMNVTPEQVQNLDIKSTDPDSIFEIDYYPSTTDNEIAERRKGPTISLVSSSNPNVRFTIQFLPMDGEITFSESEIPLPTHIERHNYNHDPALISTVQHGENLYEPEGVVLQGIALTQIDECIQAAENIIFEANQIVNNIEQGQYNMRIFGNSADSPMKKSFIIQPTDLSLQSKNNL